MDQDRIRIVEDVTPQSGLCGAVKETYLVVPHTDDEGHRSYDCHRLADRDLACLWEDLANLGGGHSG